ncbi:MAG TPA: FMN-binding negative transcriptional regulator [Pseudonocardiaceae bacterium]|nr:FMN-binding negative transcriptional regulator [Pseudonocardiaceae bacterium]
MYVPADYRTPDPSWVAELVSSHPLALLCTNGDGTPHATHLPVITRPGSAFEPGGMLVGHMNRANPHWSSLVSGGALLVFTGPHAYVSPTVYDVTPAAPTWDFTAVHVRGTITPIVDRGETMSVITATVSAFESRLGNDWDMGPSCGYFNKIVPGVGAFRFEIDDIQAMFKLSQEQRPEVRQRVWQSFADSEVGQDRALADLIARAVEHDAHPNP